jgi:prepilin-type N-terminal cleavage/methylation domain-containing protein
MASRPQTGPPAARGYTLIELVVVTFLIALILSVAMPRLLPAVLFGELRGAANHLTGYGRALFAYAALEGETYTFTVDVDEGEYWTVRWLVEEGPGDAAGPAYGAASPFDAYAREPAPGSEEALEAEAAEMEEQFRRFMELSLQAQARNVPSEGILDETQPLFEDDFDLEWDDQESAQEVRTDLLTRTRLPRGVEFESVYVGGVPQAGERVEVDVSPLGLSQEVVFVITRDDDAYTVTWDAVTGGTRMEQGRAYETAEEPNERPDMRSMP